MFPVAAAAAAAVAVIGGCNSITLFVRLQKSRVLYSLKAFKLMVNKRFVGIRLSTLYVCI